MFHNIQGNDSLDFVQYDQAPAERFVNNALQKT
jgi:hypothetical protein